MPLVLGIDLGTTTITALVLDAQTGTIRTSETTQNTSAITASADKSHGRSEWDARRIADTACRCLRSVTDKLGAERAQLVGLGITGQQHGVVLVDASSAPLTPFINWQDQRGEETVPGAGDTYVRRAIDAVGPDAPRRTGCRLATGYLGLTLFWMKQVGTLPNDATACFLMDYFAAVLTGCRPATDPTCAASGGIFDVSRGHWDNEMIAALGLPHSVFPEVRPSGDRLGGITPAMAEATGLPEGLPVFIGIGDNQASFLGSVADRVRSVLVNVGTGAQVATYHEAFRADSLLETRPFPRGGFLLVAAGLCGGSSYAVLECFFRSVGTQLLGAEAKESLYEHMNGLAAEVPSGADGLRCEPLFSGTRARPALRAAWTGASVQNFTPAHMTRALLEGMARTFHDGYQQTAKHTHRPRSRIVGAGNGLRANPVLARIVASTFELPLSFPLHREEAAYGAALLAAVSAGVQPDLNVAGKLIRYTEPL
ncbi:MAG: hypothetical protein K2R98_15405 [Gemmataceae bacterium]|nr:hypothetical protein [Gemmataceae bacterium]